MEGLQKENIKELQNENTNEKENTKELEFIPNIVRAVSYTHLDVYKRQYIRYTTIKLLFTPTMTRI